MSHTDATTDAASTSNDHASPPATPAPDIAPAVEAVLFSAERPTQAIRIAEALGLIEPSEAAPQDTPAPTEAETPAAPTAEPTEPKKKGRSARSSSTADRIAATEREQAVASIQSAVRELNKQYEATGRSFRIEEVSGGYRVMTLPRFAQTIAEFHKARLGGRLSRQAVETLAIIAYKQPITRAELEAIRGVSCGEVLKSLIERRLVTVRGRAEELGRPLLYGTTKPFLDHFGLASIKDLPTLEEVRAG